MTDQPLVNYGEEYNQFIAAYKSGTTDAVAVGELIARMAQHFVTYNLKFAEADFKYSRKAAQLEGQVDEVTLKPISSSKAKVMADGTDEAMEKIYMAAHVGNIDTIIQALKALQKSLMREWQHSAV